jgi:superfamily II DNA or RNA helicase
VAKHRTKPDGTLAEPWGSAKGFILRPYQQELIDQSGAALKAKRSPLVMLPTGGGKTALIAVIVRLNRSTGRRSTVICHRREILQQIAGAIEHHTGEAPELVTDGSKPNWGALVLVVMVPTLARRLGQLQQGGMLLADEAHHMGSTSCLKPCHGPYHLFSRLADLGRQFSKADPDSAGWCERLPPAGSALRFPPWVVVGL